MFGFPLSDFVKDELLEFPVISSVRVMKYGSEGECLKMYVSEVHLYENIFVVIFVCMV